MFNRELGAFIGIASYRRPQNVQAMYDILNTKEVTWYLRNEEEAEAYRAAGAESIHVSEGYSDGSPADLVFKRNEILNDAFALGHPAILLSDDLKKIEQVIEDPTATGGKGGGLRTEPWDFQGAIRHMQDMLAVTPEYKLAGVPPVANLFFLHHVLSYNLFCIGDMLLVLPSEPRFDTRIKLKHDYGFTADHIKTYGGAVRCDRVFTYFEHYKAQGTGGCSDSRSYEMEDQDIKYLIENHPDCFRPHTTRAHEVTMTMTASQPSVETFLAKPHYVARAEYLGTEGEPKAGPRGGGATPAKVKRARFCIWYYQKIIDKQMIGIKKKQELIEGYNKKLDVLLKQMPEGWTEPEYKFDSEPAPKEGQEGQEGQEDVETTEVAQANPTGTTAKQESAPESISLEDALAEAEGLVEQGDSVSQEATMPVQEVKVEAVGVQPPTSKRNGNGASKVLDESLNIPIASDPADVGEISLEDALSELETA